MQNLQCSLLQADTEFSPFKSPLKPWRWAGPALLHWTSVVANMLLGAFTRWNRFLLTHKHCCARQLRKLSTCVCAKVFPEA